MARLDTASLKFTKFNLHLWGMKGGVAGEKYQVKAAIVRSKRGPSYLCEGGKELERNTFIQPHNYIYGIDYIEFF